MMMLNNKNERQHRSSTLEIILAVVAIASILVLSVLVLITTILKANAAESTTFSLDQTQTNKCNDFVGCANTGTITFLSDHIILHNL